MGTWPVARTVPADQQAVTSATGAGLLARFEQVTGLASSSAAAV